jgi:cytoskeletal protein CcmA (bactofilin family)
MGLKKVVHQDKILTIIGKDTIITGTLQGTGTVRIDGRVEGEINIDGDLIIGAGAVIQAAVKGKNIQVAGKIIGNVEATGRLEIISSGILEGDVDVNILQVEDGASLIGKCSMRRNSEHE